MTRTVTKSKMCRQESINGLLVKVDGTLIGSLWPCHTIASRTNRICERMNIRF